MTAIFGVTPYCDWSQISPLLESLDCQIGTETNPESWYLDKQSLPDGRFLLAYSSAEEALLVAMMQGEAPGDALRAWEEHAHAMVSCYKTNRSKAVLLNVSQAADHPEHFAEALANHWDVDITASTTSRNTLQEAASGPCLHLIAKMAIYQNHSLPALLSQLEACSLPMGASALGQKSLPDLDANYREIVRLRENDRKLTIAVEQSRQAHKQLHLVQEELERNLKAQQDALAAQQAAEASAKARKAEIAELQKQEEEFNEKQKQLEQSLQQVQTEKADLEEENRLVIEQLHLVQEELERQITRNRVLDNQLKDTVQEQEHALAAANSQITRLQTDLNRIKESAAWKAVAPVRAMSRPFKRLPPEKRKLKKQAERLNATPYFDETWYLRTYPDVAESQANPAEHYLKFGAQEGRNPSPDFDTSWYVQANPDVQESGINPLIHFLDHGQEEGRAPNSRVQSSLPSPQEAK